MLDEPIEKFCEEWVSTPEQLKEMENNLLKTNFINRIFNFCVDDGAYSRLLLRVQSSVFLLFLFFTFLGKATKLEFLLKIDRIPCFIASAGVIIHLYLLLQYS